MCKLYDEIIEGIHPGIKLDEVAQTNSWLFACSNGTIGSAMNCAKSSSFSFTKYQGAQLQEVTTLVKS